MGKRLITVLGVMGLLLLTSCNIEDEGIIRDDKLNTNSVSSNTITSDTLEDSNTTETAIDTEVEIVVVQKLDITLASTYECLDKDILEKDVVIVSEDESIDRVYYSPNKSDFIVAKLEDLVYDHKKTYVLNENEIWNHYMEYKELPLYKNFSSQPIWISDVKVFLNDMEYDFQRADNKLVGLNSNDVDKRMFLGDLSNIRGFSINDEYTKIVLNNDVEYGSDELNGLLVYDIDNDSIDILKESTFNLRNRDFDNYEMIEADIYSYAFESNLRQNMVWGKDDYIYYTDAVLDENLLSRIDRIDPSSQEYETLLENAYILCESPDKAFMVYNDLNEQKTVVWNMDLNKKFVVDLSYEFTWDHGGQRAVYKPIGSEEAIYLIEFIDDKVQTSSLDIKSYMGENMRVVNLGFDQIGHMMFDVLVNKYAEKEMADYVAKVITYDVDLQE